MREKTTKRRQKDEFVVLAKTSSPVRFKGKIATEKGGSEQKKKTC
jgi:hypothetical protein